MQRTTRGTPFKLRSGSPFKEVKRMVRKTDDNRNELVDVTKGKTNVRKTWKQAWADNDEGIQGMYGSYDDYVADRKGQKTADSAAYEADLVSKTGVSGGPGTETTPDTVTPVASPGVTTPEVRGDMKDTFTPQDIRMADRERKIVKNRTNKANRKIRNKTNRYDKALGKAGYVQGMEQPPEFTTNEAGDEVPNTDAMNAWESNEAIKATFDKTRKGGRLKDKIESAQGDKEFYSEHSQRIQEGADQGVNPNKGRMIEEGRIVKGYQPESTTEGSDQTFVEDGHGYDVYDPSVEDDSKLSTDNKKVDSTGTDDQGGDGKKDERGVIETITGSDLNPDQQRVQANLQRKAGSMILKNMPGGSITHALAKGIMGSGEHKSDFDGDRDSFLEPTWWDGAKSKLSNWWNSTNVDQSGGDDKKFSHIDPKTGNPRYLPPETEKPKPVGQAPGTGQGSGPEKPDENSTNKFGGPKMKFGNKR